MLTNKRIHNEMVDWNQNKAQSIDSNIFQTRITFNFFFGDDVTEFQLAKENDCIRQY